MFTRILSLVLATSIASSAFAAYAPNQHLNSGTDSVSVSGTVSVSNLPSTQPISANALPLPSGAATSAKQDSLLSAIGSPFQAGASIANTSFGISGTLPAFSSTPTFNLGTLNGAATAAGLTTINSTLGSPFQAGASIANTSFGISGTLPAFASTPTVNLGTINGIALDSTLSAMSAKLPALGQSTMSGSQPVTFASDQTALTVLQPDLFLTGQSAQTAIINNILPATASANATDASGYRSGSIQVVSTGTAGTFILEGSNDNVNFQTTPMYNQLIATGTPILAAVTASASQIVYSFPIKTRYIRLRIATAITGGSLQTFTRISQESWSPAINTVANATAANLQTTATIASGTVTTVGSMTSGNLAIPGIIADVASAALTTTTTTATLTPTFGNSYVVSIPVTVVSGTTPILDVEVQESDDTGTNWFAVYDFPRITATGIYRSPPILFIGNRIRYVQTVAGTTPSFTRAVNRLQMSSGIGSAFRQIIDRTISLTTLSSVTPTLVVGGAKNLQLTINIGAATTPPAIQIQCSDDAGASYYKIGSPLTAVASSSVSTVITNTTCQMAQAVVTTIGATVTAGYVMVRAF